MKVRKTLTMMIMDPPYESSQTTTALRMVHSAIKQGHNVNVFAFEGAVSLTMRGQKPHANPVKETSIEAEKHPTTKDWVSALFAEAKRNHCQLDWVNCGFCVDERGAGDWIDGPRRGGPADFSEMIATTDALVVIPTK